jgi:hypothetical protein
MLELFFFKYADVLISFAISNLTNSAKLGLSFILKKGIYTSVSVVLDTIKMEIIVISASRSTPVRHMSTKTRNLGSNVMSVRNG